MWNRQSENMPKGWPTPCEACLAHSLRSMPISILQNMMSWSGFIKAGSDCVQQAWKDLSGNCMVPNTGLLLICSFMNGKMYSDDIDAYFPWARLIRKNLALVYNEPFFSQLVFTRLFRNELCNKTSPQKYRECKRFCLTIFLVNIGRPFTFNMHKMVYLDCSFNE